MKPITSSVAKCIKCYHRIYRDEDYERHPFTDASGNNDAEYNHVKCPTHHAVIKEIEVTHRCTDCGVSLTKIVPVTEQTLDLIGTLQFMNLLDLE